MRRKILGVSGVHKMDIKISEIFTSIDGEVNYWGQGKLTTFIRLYGCNLQCLYCDTKYSWHGSFIQMPVREIVEKITANKVTITGGEPLLQYKAVSELIGKIYKTKKISLETNGTIGFVWLKNTYPDISIVMDIKEHYWSQYNWHELVKNISCMDAKDYVKIVFQDKEKALCIIRDIQHLNKDINIALSVVDGHKNYNYRELIDFLLDKKITEVSINVQLHKLIGER